MRENLLTFLEDCLRRPRDTAFVDRIGLRRFELSYGWLRTLSFQIARELEERGIGKGDRVLFWAANSAEWVAAFFGCLLRGAIVVPLDAETTDGFVQRVQEQIEARLLLTDESRRAGIGISIPALDLASLARTAARHSASAYSGPQVVSSDIAEIVFTSGTTAEPKGVCLTHRNLLANIAPIEREIQKYLRWERLVHPIRFLNLLPLSHVFGQFMGIFIPQLIGGEIHFLDSLKPGEIIETVRRQRISVIVTVPRILESLRAAVERDVLLRDSASAGPGSADQIDRFHADLERMDRLSFWKRWWVFRAVHRRFGFKFWAFVSGGASLPAETETFWRRVGFAVVQGYGMTETASLVTVNHPFKVGRGSIGKTLPGQEVKINDQGEIMVRGENVSPGYWKRGVVTVTHDGWLNTGDIAERDDEGNLYFKSRSKDVIVTAAGMNIYPDDLEAALKLQPEVRDCAVVAEDGTQGPEPMAVLIPAYEGADAAGAVRRANKSLNQYQQIRNWRLWTDADFPRTATEKVRKPAIKDAIRATAAKNEAGQARVNKLAENRASSFVLQQISRITGQAPVSAAASASLSADLKLDSLGRIELLAALEDEYHLDLEEGAFTAATTLGDIDRLIRAAQASPAGAARAVVAQVASGSMNSNAAPVTTMPPGSRVAIDSRASKAAKDKRPYPSWQLTWPVRLFRLVMLYALILPITWLMSRARTFGREKLNEVRGPVLVVSNHVAMVDQALVLLALPARLRNRLVIAMEGERLWAWINPPKGTGVFGRLLGIAKYFLVVSMFNVFPLPQKSGFRRSFAFAGDCVDRGNSVLVFPEGRRTETGEMDRFMDGIGLLATGLRVPVVPVRIDGLWEMKRDQKYFARPGRLIVRIGPPVSFEASESTEIARELESRVRSLD
jgi:long-chain acyl-CoA synthetase